ncbi:hypothetical protein [Streptomyces sp. A0958]|uniref:hypothetical protein n=1 Tax=Streptomyces sp. A0958 TaxID=2563101 RepID=UPI001F0FE6DA|nr:hypothetical protein [Streptomyces sp. A0958]
MGVLIGMCADDSRAAAALAVPFLIRIATDPHHRHRADALCGLAAPARARHFGVASRDELLLHRSGPQHDDYDDYGVEVTGYPAGWSVAAARAVITTGAPVLLPLLDASDPAMRIDASYVLATAADPGHTVRSAFATRSAKEQDPMVRAALVLATAETTRAHPHQPATGWIRELWQDRAQAPEARLAAAIGWLALTNEPAPETLHTTVEALASAERARAINVLPWMAAAGGSEPGLLRCVRRMLHPEEPEPSDDPWA